jgi:hypothetical protein
MRCDLIPAGGISRELARRIDSLVRDLLQAGKREGAEWCVPAVASPFGCSVSVHLAGGKAGVWSAWAVGKGGDALALVHAVLDVDMTEALRWSRSWLRLDEGAAELPPRPAPAVDCIDVDKTAKQERALNIWRGATESIADTPAEIYLRSRGFDPARLNSLWGARQWPATLRYSERAARDPGRVCRALIVAVHGADCGLVRAIQRILLNLDGSAVRDDRNHKRKLSLGPIAGNAARFDYWPDPAGRWGIAEGCETALAAFALTGIPTWAGVSAGNMARVMPPSWARQVTIFADRDPPGMAAAGEMLHRLRALPTLESVRIVGSVFTGQDAADLLAGGHRHAG